MAPRFTRFRKIFGLDPKPDVEAELAFHVEMRIRELIEQGEAPERARRMALERFGDYERARRECVAIDERRKRRMIRMEYLSELKQDIGYALRTLWRTPAFTIAALLTLALGIGANSAIFSVVHGVLLESLPFRDAQHLHQLRMLYPDGTRYSDVSAPDFMSVRSEARVFEQVEAINSTVLTLTGSGEPREIDAMFVSPGLLDMLGVDPLRGRRFINEEHRPDRGNVAVLSEGFWKSAFGGDDSVIGRSLILSGRPATVIGVAKAIDLEGGADVYLPLTMDQRFDASTIKGRRSEFLLVIARARPDVAAAAIAADLKRIGDRLQDAFPETNGGIGLTSTPLREMIVGDVQRPLFVLLGAVGFVLLVACANVANLLLARGAARHGELSVRAALGAGRARLIRQLVTESMVLGLIGGALGLALAYWGTHALVAARPADLPRIDAIRLDGSVALFTLAASLFTGFVFGLIPAVQATNENLVLGLQESGRNVGGRRTHRLRAALVIAEMALAVVLLTGSGLLIRSFVALTQVNPGFRPDGAVSIRVAFQGAEYQNGDQIRPRVDQLLTRLRGLPGVTGVAVSSVLPLGGNGAMLDFAVDGAAPPPPDVNQEIAVASVSPVYFTVIGAPLKRGRLFTDFDQPKAPPVALINEAAVKRWFPDSDPIGKTVLSGGPHQVVGIVGDVLQRSPGEPAVPQLFLPYAQRTGRNVRVVVRVNGDPLAIAPAMRGELRALDANLPIAQAVPLTDMVSRSIARPRFYTSLLTLFAAVALALSATGIFGVMSYAVAQQSKEIGIRMALGAAATDVLRSVVGRALVLAGAGVAIGVVVALAVGGVIRSQLFGVTPFDPLTIAIVMIVLLGSAVLASLWPAARAARIDPMSAFRQM